MFPEQSINTFYPQIAGSLQAVKCSLIRTLWKCFYQLAHLAAKNDAFDSQPLIKFNWIKSNQIFHLEPKKIERSMFIQFWNWLLKLNPPKNIYGLSSVRKSLLIDNTCINAQNINLIVFLSVKKFRDNQFLFNYSRVSICGCVGRQWFWLVNQLSCEARDSTEAWDSRTEGMRGER